MERGSFSAVGRDEGIGQPAVSKQIAALERHLGAQLLLRTSRRIAITDASQTFYEAAKRLVDDLEAAEASVGQRQHAPRGVVRLDVAPAHGRLCIIPLLAGFLERFPDVSVDLSASAKSVDLLAESVDVAIRHGALADSALTARPLSSTRMVLVATESYLAIHGVPTRLHDLDHHACLVFMKGRERAAWQFRIGKNVIAYTPHGRLLTRDAEAVRAGVLNGMGIAQAPGWLFGDQIRRGQVRRLMMPMEPVPIPIHLVHAAGRRVPGRVRALMDYLVAAYAGTHI